MKRYIKEGKIKRAHQIVLVKDDYQIFNPTHEMILDDGWIEVQERELTPEEIFNSTKIDKLNNLTLWDESPNVNECYIDYNGARMSYWANKQERSTLKTAVQDCVTMGLTTYRLDLREFNICFNIPCETMLQMLAALEVYAIQCYNKTTDHIFNINNIKDITQLETYDFTQGYPQKLLFTINT